MDEIDPPENTKRNLEKSLDKDYEDPIVILTIYHKDDEKPVAMIHANLLPDGHHHLKDMDIVKIPNMEKT